MIITLCGGGSTFTPGIVKSIALRKDELDVDEIRLYDINEERQRKIGVLVDTAAWARRLAVAAALPTACAPSSPWSS